MRFVAVGLLLLVASPVLAQSGGMYDLTWSTVDGGGTLSAGEGYSVAGTIGQSEAGLISGGDFTVGGGFLPGGEIAPEYRIYLPLVLRSYP